MYSREQRNRAMAPAIQRLLTRSPSTRQAMMAPTIQRIIEETSGDEKEDEYDIEWENECLSELRRLQEKHRALQRKHRALQNKHQRVLMDLTNDLNEWQTKIRRMIREQVDESL